LTFFMVAIQLLRFSACGGFGPAAGGLAAGR
jgi:hypothetical protein